MQRAAKRTAKRGSSVQWVLLGTLTVLAAGAVVFSVWHAGPAGDTPVAVNTTSTTDRGGIPVDWERPIGGTTVDSNDEAAAHLSFAPAVPQGLGKPVKIKVDDPSADHAGKNVAWVYQHPTYGRFFVIEGFSAWTQRSLEALATCDHTKGCQGEWSLVRLKNGATGVQFTGGPTTGVIWLWHGLTIHVYGPTDTFSLKSAKAVADSVS